MLQNLTGWHALIVLAVVILIFGAAKLPALARSVGQSMRILKDEVRTDEKDDAAAPASPASAAGTPTTAVAVPAAVTPIRADQPTS